MNDSITKNQYYYECIPLTTAKIDFNGLDTSFECCCYHFMGITINISEHFNDEEICGICLKKWDLRNNEIIRLSCNHYFHKECVLNWFDSDISNSCPVCRCPHDSFNTAERQLALETLNNEIYKPKIRNNSNSNNPSNPNNSILAYITHILPFSVTSAQSYNVTSLLAKDFTVTSVISEILFNKLKEQTKIVKAERDEPTFYINTDNDIFMSDEHVTLPVSFPYIYYKNSFLTNNLWVEKYGKTPIILVNFKIINFIQEDLLLVSKYDLSKNCIEAVTVKNELKKDACGNEIDDIKKEFNYSLMKKDGHVSEEFLIPYAYVKKTHIKIDMLSNSKQENLNVTPRPPSFNIINIMPPS